MKAQHVPDPLRPILRANTTSMKTPRFSGAIQPAQAVTMVANAAKTLTETATKQTLTSAVSHNGIIPRLKQYFSNPAKVAIWTPALLHVPGTTIQPFFTWLGLKQSGVDQNQVNTLTQMEIVRSLTSHAMNLTGSVLPVVASELFNKNVDELNKMIKWFKFNKASSFQQLGFIILANTLLYGVVRPLFTSQVAAKTFLKANAQKPVLSTVGNNNRLMPPPSVGILPYGIAPMRPLPMPAGAPFFGSSPFVMPPHLQGPAIVPIVPASLSTSDGVR